MTKLAKAALIAIVFVLLVHWLVGGQQEITHPYPTHTQGSVP